MTARPRPIRRLVEKEPDCWDGKRSDRLQVEDPPVGGDEPNRRLAVSSLKANPDNEVYRELQDRKNR